VLSDKTRDTCAHIEQLAYQRVSCVSLTYPFLLLQNNSKRNYKRRMIFSFLLTVASFVIGHHFEHGLHSALCSVVISTLNYYSFTQDAMKSFLLYLCLDLSKRHKDDPLSTEIFLHHSISILITTIGLYLCNSNIENVKSIYTICSYLLNMEITNSLLYLGKRFKKRGQFLLASISLIFLIICWIPFRIVYPLKALYITLDIFPNLRFVQIIIFSLLYLQIIWLTRLLRILINSGQIKNECPENFEKSIIKKKTIWKNNF
jgi:hypothetical protein